MDLVEAFQGGRHGLRNFSHQYRCPQCGFKTGGQLARSAAELGCRCGATLVEVNSHCQHDRFRPMLSKGRYQCCICSRILIERPRTL